MAAGFRLSPFLSLTHALGRSSFFLSFWKVWAESKDGGVGAGLVESKGEPCPRPPPPSGEILGVRLGEEEECAALQP